MPRIRTGYFLIALLLALIGLGALVGARALGEANRVQDTRDVARKVARDLELIEFSRARDTVAALARHPSIVEFLRAQDDKAQSEVNAVLLQARLVAGAAIVYVLDGQGRVLANATRGLSLVGHDYSFRPYFIQAMGGHDSLYGALGVTTKQRGFYFSSPVGPPQAPRGVVVAKLGLEGIDAQLRELPMAAALLSPDAVVFATNRDSWLYRTGSPIPEPRLQTLRESRQFAEAPLVSLGVDLSRDEIELGHSRLTPVWVPLGAADGWSLVLADPHRAYPLTEPQQRFFAGAVGALGLLGALVVALLLAIGRGARAEASLKLAEENLALTLDSIGDAVIASDEQGRVSRMNPVASRLTGWPFNAARGRPLGDVMRREDSDDPQLRVRHSESPMAATQTGVLIARDGTKRHIAECTAPIRSSDPRHGGIVVVFRDISDELELREQLQQSQKMEAVGQLAGGVAHDFNNLLTSILGNAELLRMKLSGHAVSEHVSEIVQASSRAGDLTRQLLTFSRKGPLRRSRVNLHEVIQEVLSLLGRGLDSRIRVESRLGASNPYVVGDTSQLHSALLNLCINARDAMPEGGRLLIATRNASSPDETGKHKPQLEVEVEDSGIGIPLEARKRIFEPFFTTKEQGKGTGLGLAAVYGCIQAHKGLIEVESKEGLGTTFLITLDAAEGAADERPAEPELPVAQKQEHWVIADDEPSVRRFTCRALESFGFTVESFPNGSLALQYIEQNQHRIAGVVLDIAMPELRGDEVYDRVRVFAPRLPVLFVSGYSEQRMSRVDADLCAGFLAKPFSVSALGQAVRGLSQSLRPAPSAAD